MQAHINPALPIAPTTAPAQASTVPCTSAYPSQLGILQIPGIHLVAPVVQGDGDAQLADAVGHVPASSLPGTGVTSVLAAHDVTWFHNLTSLHAGDTLSYISACHSLQYQITSMRVVQAGYEIHNRPNRLALVTCWPLDALFYTNQRYLVEATLVGGAATATDPALTQHFSAPASGIPPVLAPVSTLDANPTLLGTLTVTGSPSARWTQSPTPLDTVASSQAMFFAAMRAARDHTAAQWASWFPGATWPGIAGVYVTPVSPLDTTLTVQGGQVSKAVVQMQVRISGAPNATVYNMAATEVVSNGHFVLASFTLQPS